MRLEPEQRDGAGGFVLIAVLSILAVLSGLVLAMQLLSRASVDTARLESEELDIDTMVRSAIALTGYQLFILKQTAGAIDGQQIRLNRGVVSVSVSSEASKVDINGAGKELLSAVYRISGLRSMNAESFAARVIDWRDSDEEALAEGAERQGYGAAGLPYGPRNAAFRSVADLRYVIGVSEADALALSEWMTVFNPDGRLDVFAAPEALIAALPGVTVDMVDQVRAARGTRTDAAAARLADLLLVQSAFISADNPRSYRVVISARLEREGRTRRVEVVMAPGVAAASPYQILSWRQ